MAKFYEALDEKLIAFIEAQPMFFIATAASAGRINLSPKGLDTLRVLNARRVAYLDLTGSGNETSAHARVDGRATLMFCSFTRNSRILRLFGTGRVVRPDDIEFDSLRTYFAQLHPGVRAAIVVDVDRIADSCGYAVPYYELVDERPVLDAYHCKQPDETYTQLIADRNRQSIDCLPALDPDHPLPPTVER